MLFLERGSLLEMLLFNCRTVHITIEIQLNGLSDHSDTGFGVPRIVLVSFRTCIMKSAQETKHPGQHFLGRPATKFQEKAQTSWFSDLWNNHLCRNL